MCALHSYTILEGERGSNFEVWQVLANMLSAPIMLARTEGLVNISLDHDVKGESFCYTNQDYFCPPQVRVRTWSDCVSNVSLTIDPYDYQLHLLNVIYINI